MGLVLVLGFFMWRVLIRLNRIEAHLGISESKPPQLPAMTEDEFRERMEAAGGWPR